MGKLDTARAFSVADWRLLLEAWLTLARADFLTRNVSLNAARRAAGTLRRGPPLTDTAATMLARTLQRFVRIAARHHVRPMLCLPQALTLQWMLSRRGVACEFRIGVKPGAQTFAAHAWIEHNGTPIGEARDVGSMFSAMPLPATI